MLFRCIFKIGLLYMQLRETQVYKAVRIVTLVK